MKKKKLLTLFAAAAFSLSAAAATNLVVDGTQIAADVPPVVVSGRTLVPVRALFESLGASVGWDEPTQTATASKGTTVVSVQIGSTTALVNGSEITLDVPAQTIEGRTMVPARFVAESLGATVTWENATETVYISTSGQPTSAPSTPAQPKKPASTAQAAPSSQPAVQPSTPTQSTAQPTKKPAVPANPAPAESSTSKTVYITKTGKRYHYDNHCNGGTYIESTLKEAQSRGLTPCNKCVR